MEIEDSFGFDKKGSERSNPLKREYSNFASSRNETSRNGYAPEAEDVGECGSEEGSLHDEIPLFPQEIRGDSNMVNNPMKIPDPISFDSNF